MNSKGDSTMNDLAYDAVPEKQHTVTDLVEHLLGAVNRAEEIRGRSEMALRKIREVSFGTGQDEPLAATDEKRGVNCLKSLITALHRELDHIDSTICTIERIV